jgi:hypothetical protein
MVKDKMVSIEIDNGIAREFIRASPSLRII